MTKPLASPWQPSQMAPPWQPSPLYSVAQRFRTEVALVGHLALNLTQMWLSRWKLLAPL